MCDNKSLSFTHALSQDKPPHITLMAIEPFKQMTSHKNQSPRFIPF